MEFLPQNKLEHVLMSAATEPAYRPEFFNILLESTVYVLGRSEGGDLDAASLATGVDVDLQHWERTDGDSAIPFFSSLDALQQVIKEEQGFLALPARTLFEITQGATLFLNPRLPYGKEFLPQEIAHLLSDEGGSLVEQHIIDGEGEISISAVEHAPSQMVDSLTQLFKQHHQVHRAYLAQIKETGDEAPHWLIGLDAVGDDIEAIIQSAGAVAMDTQPEAYPVDICLVDNDEPGISHFLIRHTTPFYERKWGSFLRDFKNADSV
ncbi:enhanced serine sensitivity protein SseB [Musicola keenii]|uniref:enhanced serine sensitivity protein SseB n=1 Tax=Musicola keenii TaxID=2884250 RepID=UPI00177B8957|nr:enhanced serine sensitivity protein SseB [Musicola keenii]